MIKLMGDLGGIVLSLVFNNHDYQIQKIEQTI